jgi:hypothetical protein
MNATKQLEDAVFFTALNLSDLEQRKLFLDLELWSGVARGGWPPERHRCGIGAGLGFKTEILKGFYHSARRWPMKSGYAGVGDKTSNPEGVESVCGGCGFNPFRVGKYAGRFPGVGAARQRRAG